MPLLISRRSAESRPARANLPALDRAGIFLSSICFVHCLALPVALVFVPALSPLLPPDLWVHVVLFGAAFPVTGFTLFRGYLAHRNPWPAALGAMGLAAVACGLLSAGPIAAAALTIFGGLAVACAHVLNVRDHAMRTIHTHQGHAA